ncbi:hypothetical protein sos41_01230 [Alphaproteobacteria bacterium SO-S41]|nr:hypothetical protein sos41_01230 [Alphaproteobacteria bacterium SO-S41]
MQADAQSRRGEWAIFALGPVAIGLLSLWLGQSTSWDLRNYHWYNPYALLHGRMAFDAAVAHHATYYNPLIDLPLWVVGNAAPGWAAALFLGLVQGLNFSFLYLIARDAISPETALRRPLAVVLAALGVSGGYAVILTGTTYYDNVVSIPVLAALWLIVRDRVTLDAGDWRSARRTAVIAGVLAGLAVGLKLPTAPFGLAVLAAIAVAPSLHGRRIALVFTCGVAAFFALMLASGWWFFILWRETGNPLFPYFNDLIGSSLILDSSYRDTRFLPGSFSDAILFPFRAALDWRVSSDWQVNDWRVAFAYVAVPLALLVMAVKASSPTAPIARRPARILFAFAIAAYVSWLAVFAIYRYITPLEMLGPLLIAAAIGLLPLPGLLRWGTLAAALIAVVALTSLYKGNRTAFTPSMVEVAVPAIARPEATLAVMTGVEPMGFVIPAFPPEIAFLRVDGFLVGPGARTPFLGRMMARVEAHLAEGGDLFTLFLPAETERGDRALSELGLKRTDECADVKTNLAPSFRWCRVIASGSP